MSTSRENMHRMQTRKPMNKCRVIGHKGARPVTGRSAGARPVPGRSAGARPVPGRSAWHTVGAVEEFRYSKLQCATPGRVAADGDRPRSGTAPATGGRSRPGALATLLRSAVGTFMLSASCLFAGQQISAAAPSPTPAAATVLKQDTIPSAQPSATSIVPDSTTDTNGSVTLKMDVLDEKHKLAIGDRLSFRIEEDQEDPKPLTITDSGELELPYLGRFPAENKTCKQLAQEIKSALEKEYYYQATVIIAVDLMTKSRGRIYLVGPVRVPGPQEIPSDEVLTLSKAIMRAGGFNDYADKHNVKVTRKAGPTEADNKTFVVDVSQVFEKCKTERDLPLEPGDIVLVPERLLRL